MPNIQFPCPACAQTIECDEQHAGLELACPLCGTAILAPAGQAAAPAPAAPAPKKGKLSVSAAPHAAHSAPVNPPIHTLPPLPKKKPIDKGPIIKTTVALIAIPVILYFSWPYLKEAQRKFSAKADEAGAGSGGGELGHIAELHSVIDATDPANMSSGPAPEAIAQAQAAVNQQQEASAGQDPATPGAPPASSSMPALPAIPPSYTLKLDETEIPNSRLNGTVAGGEFKPDLVRFEKTGQNYVLLLRQGTNGLPDRELVIFLRPDGKLEHNISIGTEFKSGNPQITKKWKTGPRLFGQKNFSAGYVMKLELQKVSNGSVPGKIYVALPDAEKTVVAGHFIAQTSLTSVE